MGDSKQKAMEKKGCLVKSCFVMYIISGLLLILLAYIVSKTKQQDLVARWGVIVVYVVSCMAGGFVMGKWKRSKRFLWGILAGVAYVVILVIMATVIGGGSLPSVSFLVTTSAICICSAMLGGMIS